MILELPDLPALPNRMESTILENRWTWSDWNHANKKQRLKACTAFFAFHLIQRARAENEVTAEFHHQNASLWLAWKRLIENGKRLPEQLPRVLVIEENRI